MTRQRYRQHGNPFNVRGPIVAPDWLAVYGRRAPLALDIGFGAGHFLLALAQKNPQWNVLGLEIRSHFVERLLADKEEAGITNLHAMVANANSHLMDLLPERSVAFVALNFPDPWYKKRHQKRRVLNATFLDVLARKMLPNAELHTMTDYEPGAQQAFEILTQHADFESEQNGFADTSTTGFCSEREESHLKRGDKIYRLRFAYRPAGR